MRALILAAILVAAPIAQERPLPDFDAFATEVKKRLATDDERQSGYVFTERRLEQRSECRRASHQRIGEGLRGVSGSAG